MPAKGNKTLELKVERDPTFVRIYADNAAALPLGPDLELALLITTPDVSEVQSTRQPGGTELTMEAKFAEVARVRMSTRTAISTAFNIIFALLQEEKLDSDHLRSNIEDMIKQLSSNEGSKK